MEQLPGIPENGANLPALIKPGEVRVVDESGREIVRPDVVQAITQFAMLAQLTRIRKSVEREHIDGKIDPRLLNATETQTMLDLINYYPWKPWATVFIINYGPDPADIALNNPWDWETIKINETRTIDNVKANARIERIYYKCAAGDTASVRFLGQY